MLQSTLKMTVAIAVIAVASSVFLGETVTRSQDDAPIDPASPAQAVGPARLEVARNADPRAASSLSGAGSETLTADRLGHFSARLEVDGVEIPALVDTGATMVAFSALDAERAGLRPLPADYKYRTNTANGEVAVALVKVRRLRLGSIVLDNVDAAVLPEGALKQSLLGMSFLKRLALFQAEGDRLVLRQ